LERAASSNTKGWQRSGAQGAGSALVPRGPARGLEQHEGLAKSLSGL